MKQESEPPTREISIRASSLCDLQTQIDAALTEGCNKINLEGTFFQKAGEHFSMLRLTEDVEIFGPATLNGKDKTTHLVFVEKKN